MTEEKLMERIATLNAKAEEAEAAGYTVYMGKVYTSTKPTEGPSRYVCNLENFGKAGE